MVKAENNKQNEPVAEENDRDSRVITDVHKKKRRKNLALLALILGWIFLIWMITMVRISQAQAQDVEGLFHEQRTTHIQAMERGRETIDEGRAAHQESMAPNPEKWWEGWQDRLFPDDYKAPDPDTAQTADVEKIETSSFAE